MHSNKFDMLNFHYPESFLKLFETLKPLSILCMSSFSVSQLPNIKHSLTRYYLNRCDSRIYLMHNLVECNMELSTTFQSQSYHQTQYTRTISSYGNSPLYTREGKERKSLTMLRSGYGFPLL